MRDLVFFQKRFAPVSMAMSFVNGSFEKILQFSHDHYKKIFTDPEYEVKFEIVDGSLEKKLLALLPLNGRKTLVTQTKDGGVAYFSNNPITPTVESEPILWCEKFSLRQIWIIFKDVQPSDHVGSVQFNYHDYSLIPNRKRNVYSYKDGRWSFDQHWEPFPFEDVEAYKARRIKDRLTPVMVERYCQEFGIEPFDPDFYEGKGFVMSMRPYPNFPELLKYPNR